MLSGYLSQLVKAWFYSHVACILVPGPSCSKLTMSLVNDSLKFLIDMQIC